MPDPSSNPIRTDTLRTDPPSAFASLTAAPELPPGLDPTVRALLVQLQWERSNATTHLMELMQSQAQHNERRSRQVQEQIELTHKLLEKVDSERMEQMERHAVLLTWLAKSGISPTPGPPEPDAAKSRPSGPGALERMWRRLPAAAQMGVAVSIGSAISAVIIMVAGAAFEAVTGHAPPMPTVPTSVPATLPIEVPT